MDWERQVLRKAPSLSLKVEFLNTPPEFFLSYKIMNSLRISAYIEDWAIFWFKKASLILMKFIWVLFKPYEKSYIFVYFLGLFSFCLWYSKSLQMRLKQERLTSSNVIIISNINNHIINEKNEYFWRKNYDLLKTKIS